MEQTWKKLHFYIAFPHQLDAHNMSKMLRNSDQTNFTLEAAWLTQDLDPDLSWISPNCYAALVH